MGKQSKRKNKRRGGGGGGRHHRPTGLADDPTSGGGGGGTVEGDTPSAVANIVKKIRHGDPRVRHAALVALSSTLFDSASLTAAAKKKRKGGGNNNGINSTAADASSPSLLRALSEKVLDVDIPCATTAAGCLSNYVSFYYGGRNNFSEQSNGDDFEVASEVLVPILLRRVQTSLATIQSMGSRMMATAGSGVASKKEAAKKEGSGKKGKSATTTNNSTAMDKSWPFLKEQWSLLSLSLLTLAELIENCPLAMQRLGANAFPQFLSVLPLAGDSLQLLTTHGSLSSSGSSSTSSNISQEKEREPILDAATNASRALHSLLDDNASLIHSLPLGTAASLTDSIATPSVMLAVTQFRNTINNGDFLDMTKLHVVGSILSLRRVLVLEKATATTNDEEQLASSLQSCTNDVVVPMLRLLFEFDICDNGNTAPKQLLYRMMTLSEKLSTIKQDEQMESQIVQEVNARKEPAREIARRQKKMKEDKKKKEKELKKAQDDMDMEVMEEDPRDSKKMDGAKEEGTAAAMVVEDNVDDGNKTEKEAEEGDLKQKLDDVVQSWKDLVGSHKLALELVANLCSGGQQEEGEEGDMDGGMTYEDDDEHMWDSDDEAKLVAAAAASSSEVGGAMMVLPCEQATYDSVSSNHLPERILVFFRKWMDFLPAAMMDKSDITAPALVLEDVQEILSTCALCLGNVVSTSSLPTWSAPPAVATTIKMPGGNNNPTIENGLQWFWWELVSILNSSLPSNNNCDNYESKSHVTSVMLSLLRCQPELQTLVDSLTLDCLLGLLLSQQQQQQTSKQLEKNAKETRSNVQVHSHIISMMGVLCCLEEQELSSHARVCRALLERLRSASEDNNNNHANAMKNSAIIIHEILNVLMDIYGDDDERKEEVFMAEDVLGHFQRCLPEFKRRVKRVSANAAAAGLTVGGLGDSSGSVNQEEVDVWSETALNASRFIKYKKGG